MVENSSPVSIDLILEKIREEALSVRDGIKPLGTQIIMPHETFFWSFCKKINMRFKKNSFHSRVAPLIDGLRKLLSPFQYERVLYAGDLVCMEHEDLLRACYIKILGREPDHEGMEYNLLMLRTGRADELSIISNFINSDEAKKNRFRVKVKGLWFLKFKKMLKKIPLLGYLLTVSASMLFLPKRLEEINYSVSRFASNLEGLNRWRAEAAALVGSLEGQASTLSSDIYALKRSIRDSVIKTSQFEKFFFDFENSFRGPEELIKKKLSCYERYLDELPKGSAALDLGCGRGEWLDLLNQNGYKGIGIDENFLMVEKTRSKGFDAVKQDFLEYLKSQPDGSFSCITGFHIAEHLQFNMLMELVEASHRVLKEGGILILELPYTGGKRPVLDRFYLDPTHVRPIPPGLMKFLLEYDGRFKCDVLMLNPEDVNDPETALDYSVIGYKSK